MSDKNLIALADSFMAIFGFKRKAIISGNIIKPTAFEEETPCLKRDDGIHCNCWYDGKKCCACEEK